MMRYLMCLAFSTLLFTSSFAQRKGYWQQHVDYKIQVDVDEKNYQYDGSMELLYTNSSGQALNALYFHLYFNAFQPGSAMDHRLKNIEDPDSRMMVTPEDSKKSVSRISLLKENQIGYQNVKSLRVNGKEADFSVSGTILKVDLSEPIADGEVAKIEMTWQAQVPEQIRRSGRNSQEDIALSMAQWYPKMAHFDEFGWHLDEYVAREFVAPFGNFDVKIHINPDYIVGGSGVLQNPNEVKGYHENARVKAQNGKAIWHFKAENIHDFVWAADPKFRVDSTKTSSGTVIHGVYDAKDDATAKKWKDALKYAASFFEFVGKHFGEYPWPTYSIVQGADGGMEYGTATLVTGERSLASLVGVIYHEVAHSWYQQLFGINETVDEWFDEGFTSMIADIAMQVLFHKTDLPPNFVESAYKGYIALALSGKEEPASLLADYYDTNYAYSREAYYKGQVYAVQLGYIIGQENLQKVFKEFYDHWKFKHPTPNDFKRVAEEVSGINLKWYQNLFINTTRKIDYGIIHRSENTFVVKNESNFAMPIDLLVEYADGSKELIYIPLGAMRGIKEKENLEIYNGIPRRVLKEWFWTQPDYEITFDKTVKSIEIDPTKRLADVDRKNNVWKH